MAVWLQLENGDIRAYCTWYKLDGGEYRPDKYKTKCGMNFSSRPMLDAACDHLDCVIGATEHNISKDRFWTLMSIWGFVFFFAIGLRAGFNANFSVIGLFGIMCILGGCGLPQIGIIMLNAIKN